MFVKLIRFCCCFIVLLCVYFGILAWFYNVLIGCLIGVIKDDDNDDDDDGDDDDDDDYSRKMANVFTYIDFFQN